MQGKTPVGIRPTGLSGLGGIGKTQLAIEYAYRYRADYPDGIFWLYAAGNLTEQLAQLAQLVGLTSKEESLDTQAYAMWKYLDAHPDALVIFDNVINPSALNHPFLPRLVPAALKCHFLFTTRQRDFKGKYSAYEVKVLPDDAAMNLLLCRADRTDILEQHHPEYQTAKSICKILGCLPLALELAGAFLEGNSEISLSDYQIRLSRKGALETVDSSGVDTIDMPTRHDTAILSTLQISWEALTDENARLLLRAIGQLPNAEAIPIARMGLLTNVPLEAEPGYPSPLLQTLRRLSSASLIEELTGDTIHVHPLVFEFIRQLTPPGEIQQTFRLELADNLLAGLGSVSQLQKHTAQRGINAVLGDLRTGVELNPKNNLFISLERLASREAHHLREWDAKTKPAYFAERFYISALLLELTQLQQEAEQCLIEHNKSYLRLRWRAGIKDTNLIRTIAGHTDEVRSVAITPDGKKIISGSGSLDMFGGGISIGLDDPHPEVFDTPLWEEHHQYVIKIWDSETGQEIRTLEGHKERIEALAITSDGTKLVSASVDRTLKVWDLESGQEIYTLVGHKARLNTVVLYQNDTRVASGGWDETIKIWDLETGREVCTLEGHPSGIEGYSSYVLDLAVSPDETKLISASRDGTLKVWDLETYQEILTLEGHLQAVNTVIVTPDGRMAISGANSYERIKFWNLETGEELRAISLMKDIKDDLGQVKRLKMSYDGTKLISANNKLLTVWDFETGQQILTLGGHAKDIHDIAITPDGNRIVSASADHTLKIWDLQTEQTAKTPVLHFGKLKMLEVTLDYKTLVSGAIHTTRNQQKLYDWETGEQERSKRLEKYEGAERRMQLLENDPPEPPPQEITLIFHDLETGQTLKTLNYDWNIGFVGLFSFSLPPLISTPDETQIGLLKMGENSMFAYGIMSNDVMPFKKEAEKYYNIRLFTPFSDVPTFHSFGGEFDKSKSSSILETLFTLLEGDFNKVFESFQILRKSLIKISPNRQWAISRQQTTFKHPLLPMRIPIVGFLVSNWETGENINFLLGHPDGMEAGIEAISLSPSGKRFAVAFLNNLIEVWDVENGDEPQSFIGHQTEIEEFKISFDGTRLVARYEDGILKVWDLETNKELNTLDTDKSKMFIAEVAFSPDAKRVIVAGENNNLIVRDLITGEIVTEFIGECPFKCISSARLENKNWVFAGDEVGTVWTFELME